MMKKTLITAVLAGMTLSAMAGLDRVYYSGGWVTANINGNSYQALAQENTQTGPTLIVHGSRADGSGTKQVISGNWGSTWGENPINSVEYIELASRHNLANQFYGLRASGQIDLVYFTGSAWAIFGSYTGGTIYKAITADYANNAFLYAVRADESGVDRLTISGSAIVFNYFVGAYNYKEIETMTGVGNSFYGARADGGGLERVYWNGSAFVSQSLVSTDYKALAADAYFAGGPTYMVYGARANGTGVDRIRTDNNASSWFIDFPQLTTKDFDELATMHGNPNQFYGSALPKATTTALTTSGSPSAYRQSVTFNATVTPVPDGGTVQFMTNNVSFGGPVALTAGLATLTTTNLLRGTNVIAAIYSGSANFLGSSNSLNQVVTNHPPLAATFEMGVPTGGAVAVQVIGGKFAPTDADGDALSVTAVTQGASGTVTFDGTSITYSNTAAAANDYFTYTVGDGLSTATATVTVIITAADGFNKLSGPTAVEGGLAVSYLGIPNEKYALDETDNLAPPIIWTPVITNTASGNGLIEFLFSPVNESGFFRTRHVP